MAEKEEKKRKKILKSLDQMILIPDYPRNRNKYTNLVEEHSFTSMVGGEEGETDIAI